MTTISETAPLITEPICPPWCSGHDGVAYQTWDDPVDGRSQVRNHAEDGRYVRGLPALREAGAEVSLVEHHDHTLSPPTVAVVTGNDSTDLTPTQARELAALLIDAADRAEAWTESRRTQPPSTPAVTRPRKCWENAANPVCQPLCDGGHDPLEFSTGGLLLCRHVVTACDDFEVEVQQLTWGDDLPVDHVETDPARVWFRVHHSEAGQTPHEATDLGGRLSMALYQARAIIDGRAIPRRVTRVDQAQS